MDLRFYYNEVTLDDCCRLYHDGITCQCDADSQNITYGNN